MTADRDITLSIDVSVRLGAALLRIEMESRSRAVALVGPSGSGKSTALRIIAGIEPRATGRVVVFGATWQDSGRGVFLPPWKRGAGWVPQESVLFPHRSVRDNLAWGARGGGVEEMARRLEIEGLLDRQPRHLSGGEKQRVALGRALLAEPRLLLLDEPFAAVDRPLRRRLADSLAGYCRDKGLPLLLVSHDDGDVSALASEVWQLGGGRVILSGRQGCGSP